MKHALALGFAEARWRAARLLGRWRVIPADVARLRPRSSEDVEAIWARLLVTAALQLAWEEGPTADASGFAREAEQLLGPGELDGEFLRLELALAMAPGPKG